MQKKSKKLALHKETLRNLEESALRNAGGGVITRRCDTSDCPVGESIDTPCAPTGPMFTCGIECA